MQQQKFIFTSKELITNIIDFEKSIQESKEDKEYILREFLNIFLAEEKIDSDLLANSLLFHEENQFRAEKWLDLLTSAESYRKFLGDPEVRIELGPADNTKVPQYLIVSKTDKSMPIILRTTLTGVSQ